MNYGHICTASFLAVQMKFLLHINCHQYKFTKYTKTQTISCEL